VWPGGTLMIPPLPVKIRSVKTLTGGNPEFKQTEKGVEIKLDPKYHKLPSTIVVLELEKPAMDIVPVECEIKKPLNRDPIATCSSSISSNSKGNANSPFESIYETGEIKTHYGEEQIKPKGKKHKVPEEILKTKPWLKFHRGHVWRYWMARSKSEDPQPWLEFKTENPVTFSRVSLLEKFSRIKSFKLQYFDNGEWKTFYEGGELGNFSLQLPEPITADRVRIVITDYESDEPGEGPAIHQFDIFS